MTNIYTFVIVTTIEIWNISFIFKILQVIPPPAPSPGHRYCFSAFTYIRILLSFLEHHVNKLIHVCLFYIWFFFWLNKMFLRFIHAIVFVISSFFVMLDSILLYEYNLCFLFFFFFHAFLQRWAFGLFLAFGSYN